MLTICTHSTNLLNGEFWKKTLRSFLKKYSGPDAVLDSLIRGLSESGVPYRVNATPQEGDTVLVLSGVSALKKAIHLKQTGKIQQLIAGPNIVVHPYDESKIMCDDAIDTVLVPSEWVSNFWKHEAPELGQKIYTWHAGTRITESSSREGLPIVYDKQNDAKLLQEVREVVGPHTFFTYGSFTQSTYLNALKTAPYLVYLAQSESQGLALQEAWAHNVPTFVNTSTHWERGGISWNAPQINCPYLTPELGTVFENSDELSILIEKSASFQPKNYHDEHLSDHASTQLLLQHIAL